MAWQAGGGGRVVYKAYKYREGRDRQRQNRIVSLLLQSWNHGRGRENGSSQFLIFRRRGGHTGRHKAMPVTCCHCSQRRTGLTATNTSPPRGLGK